jgi:hypothetical protein
VERALRGIWHGARLFGEHLRHRPHLLAREEEAEEFGVLLRRQRREQLVPREVPHQLKHHLLVVGGLVQLLGL